MLKSVIYKKRTFIFALSFFLIIVFSFNSCKNFLEGATLKSELETQIEYALLPYTKVEIMSDANATNSIVPAIGDYSGKYKKGDEISLKFEPKEDYLFIEWKCEPEGSVKFDNKSERNTTAEIVDRKENIVIYPQTYLIPKIETFYPASTPGGVPQDASIFVTFNKPVKPEDFSNLSRISVLCDLKEIKNEYFMLPELSEDGKTLTLQRKPGTFIIGGSENSSYKDIVVSFNLNGLKDKDENISFKDEIKTFTYRINKEHDKDAPIVLSPFIGAINQTKLNSDSDEDHFHHGAYEEYGRSADKDKLIEQNHVGSKVYFKTQLKDVDAGVRSIVITEKLIFTKDSEAIASPQEFTTEFLSIDNSICSNENGIYSFDFEYSFNNIDDGIVRLIAKAYDYAGNEVTLLSANDSYDLLKETAVPIINIYKNSIDTVYGDEEYKVLVKIVLSNMDYSLKDFSGNTIKKFDSRNLEEVIKMHSAKILFSYDGVNWSEGYDQDEGVFVPSSETREITNRILSTTKCHISTFHRDSSKDLYIKAIVNDIYGNVFEKQEKIQRNLLVTDLQTLVNSSPALYTDSEVNEKFNVYLKFEGKEELFYHCFGGTNMNNGRKDGQTATFLNLSEISKYNVTDKTKYSIYLLPISSSLSFDASVNNLNYGSSCYYYLVDEKRDVREQYKANPFSIYNRDTVRFYSSNNLTESGAILAYTCDLYGSLSEQPYAVPNQSTAAIPSDVIPTATQIKLVPGNQVLNSNKVYFKLEYENFTEASGYTYIYKLHNNDNVSNNVFYLKDRMNLEYKKSDVYVNVVVLDSSGNKQESESIQFEGFDVDTVPPDTIYDESTQLGFFSHRQHAYFTVYPEKCVSIVSFEDTSNGFNTTSYLERTVQYWFSDKDKLTYDDLISLPYETTELDSDNKVTIYFNNHNERYLYLKASDTYGNYRIFTSNFDRKYSAWTKINNTDSPKVISMQVPVEGGQRNKNCRIYVYNAKTNELLDSMYQNNEQIDDSLVLTESNDITMKSGSKLEINTATEAYKNINYIKISNIYDTALLSSGKSLLPLTSGNLFVEYIYLPAINSTPPECNLKDVQFGARGLSVLSEKPVFVHTVYGPANLEDKILEWECKGTEAKYVEKESSFTYIVPTDIPSKNWYTTIVHYADGDVYQVPPVWKD